MIRPILGAMLVLVPIACGAGETTPISQLVELGPLTYEVPQDWVSRVEIRHEGAVVVWTPSDNHRKESITILRTRREGPRDGIGQALLGEIATAQQNLRAVKATAPRTVRTEGNFNGARVEVSFLPDRLDRRYHRSHVVLLEDAGTVVHVIYTAATPDPQHLVLDFVLDSFRAEAAS